MEMFVFFVSNVTNHACQKQLPLISVRVSVTNIEISKMETL